MTDKIAIKRAQKACFLPSMSKFAQQVRAVLLRKITLYFISKRTICAKSENCEVICETKVSGNRRNFAPKFKSIFKMNIKSIITAALALLISTACSGGAKQEKVMNKDGKSLVVFFSHAGDNYAVGNIEVGNTKIVADYITELTGAESADQTCEGRG